MSVLSAYFLLKLGTLALSQASTSIADAVSIASTHNQRTNQAAAEKEKAIEEKEKETTQP